MALPIKDWHDAPATDTPISAAALEDLEQRVSDYFSWIAWTGLAYNTSNFQDAGGSDQVGQYRKNGQGDVQLRGIAASKTGVVFSYNVTQIATLPSGFRPTVDYYQNIYVNDGGSGGLGRSVATLHILSNGVITIAGDSTGRSLARTDPFSVILNNVNFSTLA